MRRTEIRRFVQTDRARLYQTLLDPVLLPRWKVPDGMLLTVHDYEPWEGGRVRISLTYTDAMSQGKTTAHTDTYRGRFVRLVRDEVIVEEDEFETVDASMSGPMTITFRLADQPGAPSSSPRTTRCRPASRWRTMRVGGRWPSISSPRWSSAPDHLRAWLSLRTSLSSKVSACQKR